MPRRTMSPSGARYTPSLPSLGSLYEGCVVVLAILLVTLTVCRWQSDLFRAQAQLTITRKSMDSFWPTPNRCEEIFGRAVCAMLTDKESDQTYSHSATDAVKQLKERGISVVMGDDSTPLFLNFSIFCTASHHDLAVQTVNQLGGQLIQGDSIDGGDGFAPAQTRWHMVPAKTAARQSAPLSAGVLSGCLLLSMLSSCPLLIMKHSSRALRNRDETESLLGVPVLAEFAAPEGTLLPVKPRRIFQRILIVGEWILITMLLTALAAALLDTHFARQFLGQPVTALADGIRQLSALTWS